MDEEAKLLIISNEKDEDGFPVEKTEEIPIYVREKSATRSEFYDALRADIQVKTVLETRLEDWELSARRAGGRKQYATRVEYDGEVYDIVRTYSADKATIELVCS